MKKIVLILVLPAVLSLYSQDMMKVNRDSTIQYYKTENVSHITFSELENHVLRIKKKDGTYEDFHLSKVTNISFSDSVGIRSGEQTAGKFGISLLKNYPNPFNPVTTISFSLKNSGETKVDIFNYLGQYVETVHNGKLVAGNHSIKWNAGSNNASSGVYFVKVSQNGQILSSKILLIK